MVLNESQKSKRKREKKAANGLVPIRGYGTPEQKAEICLYLDGKAKFVPLLTLNFED